MLVLAACGSVLVTEIRVYGLMEMGLDACGLMLAANIGAYGLMEMGFDDASDRDRCLWVDRVNVCGLIEIGACEF